MKSTLIILPFIVLFIAGCEKDRAVLAGNTVKSTLSSQIERSNSDNDYVSTVQSISVISKSAGWRDNHDGKTQLTREINYQVELENNDTIEFGFWFIKYETNRDVLILKDDSLFYGDRRWDYKNIADESNNFYKGFHEARIIVNSNVIFHTEPNDSFKVSNVEPVLIDGQEKSLVTIEFEGTAYGFYDPYGEYQEVFTFSNGTFKGIIE